MEPESSSFIANITKFGIPDYLVLNASRLHNKAAQTALLNKTLAYSFKVHKISLYFKNQPDE